MPLSQFHPIVRAWFSGRFAAPTEAQAQGWPAIAQGTHTLIAAPTGSGKTLAAFLTCIDDLVRLGLAGDLPETTQVVYVSPLKALSNDVQKNLATPLEEISALADTLGTPIPEIRTGVRTGDTKASERQRMAKRPPHILITTPESLYLLLTSASGREGLKHVKTLVLDEIHAVADDKRGSHLSLSVERLRNLCEEPITTIGLSATQKPIEEVARFLVGSENIDDQGKANCRIVDTGHSRQLDLDIQLPRLEIGPIATHEIWGETLDTITDLARTHATTLVFVNTRRLVERVSHQLAERLGEDAVVAHHGSLSRATRLAAEQGSQDRARKGMCGHGVPGTWDRHRRGGPGGPNWVTPFHWTVVATGRAVGTHRGWSPQGPVVPPDPGRVVGERGAPSGGTPGQPGRFEDTRLAPGRAGPAGSGGLFL